MLVDTNHRQAFDDYYNTNEQHSSKQALNEHALITDYLWNSTNAFSFPSDNELLKWRRSPMHGLVNLLSVSDYTSNNYIEHYM